MASFANRWWEFEDFHFEWSDQLKIHFKICFSFSSSLNRQFTLSRDHLRMWFSLRPRRGFGKFHLTMLIIHKRSGILFIQKYRHEPYRTRIRPWDAKPLNYLIQNLALTGFEFFFVRRSTEHSFAENLQTYLQVKSYQSTHFGISLVFVWKSIKILLVMLGMSNFDCSVLFFDHNCVQKPEQRWILDNFKCQAWVASVCL